MKFHVQHLWIALIVAMLLLLAAKIAIGMCARYFSL